MQSPSTDDLLEQLNGVIFTYDQLKAHSAHDDLSDLDRAHYNTVIVRARAAIARAGGRESVYARQCEDILKQYGPSNAFVVPILMGIVSGLREDVDAGYVLGLEELIHGELFADFLDMASHLLDKGYKDPAAVVCGSVLEEHLRQLCKKNNIDTDVQNQSGARPKKAEQMNSDLARQGVYEKLDNKSVTAWLDLRNKAAHGEYDKYVKEQVALMLDGVRAFITRLPA